MDEDTILGIFVIAVLTFVLGSIIALIIAASNDSDKVCKEAVQRGYAEEVQTSRGTAYVWKELK